MTVAHESCVRKIVKLVWFVVWFVWSLCCWLLCSLLLRALTFKHAHRTTTFFTKNSGGQVFLNAQISKTEKYFFFEKKIIQRATKFWKLTSIVKIVLRVWFGWYLWQENQVLAKNAIFPHFLKILVQKLEFFLEFGLHDAVRTTLTMLPQKFKFPKKIPLWEVDRKWYVFRFSRSNTQRWARDGKSVSPSRSRPLPISDTTYSCSRFY